MRWRRFLLRGPVLSGGVLAVSGGLAALSSTWRWTLEGEENVAAMESRNGHGGGIFGYWHNRLLCMMLYPRWRHRKFATVVSRSADGEIIARICDRFGHELPRGSSSGGGKEALEEMTEFIRRGRLVGFTPDGPRGPRYTAHPGIAVLAQRTGVPIIPLAAAASRAWRARSWDRFEIPLPFAHVALAAGPLLYVSPTDSVADSVRRIEEALRGAVARAEEIAGAAS